MEIKHKECFIPQTIQSWRLQAISRYVRSAAEFVNLYSRDRGLNRFPALVRTFDLLREWPDAKRRGVPVPTADSLRQWIAREDRLGIPSLRAEVERTGDALLAQTLEWTEGVNRRIAEMVHGVPPFSLVRESLAAVSAWADVKVCSAEPHGLLRREWEEHGLAAYTTAIAGQEEGGKAEQIALAARGRYDVARVLMIGDAPGDCKAANANGARFFPINPGAEDASWEAFYRTAASQFHEAAYTAEREAERIADFEARLPVTPWWMSG
jgi:phosphoglycolate phosphatase-like HAD superfamily hydrolase